MNYWQILCGGVLALSAVAEAHVRHPEHLAGHPGQSCPVGYSMTTYYVTVTATLTPAPAAATPEVGAAASEAAGVNAASEAGPTAPSSTRKPCSKPPSPSAPLALAVSSPAPVVPPVMKNPVVASASTLSTVSKAPSAKPTVASPAAAPTTPANSSSSSGSSTALVGGVNDGQATFYSGGETDGTCMFSNYTLPAGLFGTALSVDNWDSAEWCGACVSVTGPSGNSIKAMIVNQCPGSCGLNHLDLLPDGFAKLANPQLGRIDVSWSIVACDITSPLYVQNQGGSSQWWFSVQVVNSNVPVKAMDVSTDGGKTWQPTTRAEYNFFQNAHGFGVEVVDVRITSVTGDTIIINNVETSSGSATYGTSNFS